MRKFLRTYFIHNGEPGLYGIVTRDSLTKVLPIYKFTQLIGGRTWSLSVIRLDAVESSLKFYDNTEEVTNNGS